MIGTLGSHTTRGFRPIALRPRLSTGVPPATFDGEASPPLGGGFSDSEKEVYPITPVLSSPMSPLLMESSPDDVSGEAN